MSRRHKENEAAPHAERGADLYETPACAVRALIHHVDLPDRIWEPACGPGAIVRELRAGGFHVAASDLNRYPGIRHRQLDFLDATEAPIVDGAPATAIVTNPPYMKRLPEKFIAHGLTLVPRVIMLLRLSFLEGTRRSPILDSGDLARVLPFRKRLPMMHRAGWDGPIATSRMPFAWFVWDRDWHAEPEIERISWEPFA